MQEATEKQWEAIEKHREVVKFTCGLMPDPRPLVDHVYTTCIENFLEEMRSKPIHGADIGTNIIESLYQESAVPLPGSARHNQHINYYCHDYDDWKKRPRAMTPVFTPSKLFVFKSMKEDVRLEQRTTETEINRDPGQSEPNSDPQECAIWIDMPDKSLPVLERLLYLY